MKLAVIGAGASGLVAAIKCKEKSPESEVFLFDRMDDVGKKIRATGNGKCNIGNLDQTFECYSNSQFVEEIISSYKQEETLLSLGLPTKIMYGSGLYPVSESASNVVKVLRDRALFLGVNIILNAKLLDYQIENEKINLRFDKYQAVVDKVIFAVGGKSNPNLGSDGSLFDVFARHGYLIIKPEPGLCPIRVQEDVKSLFGQRLHTIASLFINGELLFEEYGEVMFKKDGLSGIVIMNLSSLIGRLKAPNAKIYLAILNQNNEVITAKNLFEVSKKSANPLLAFVGEELATYILTLAHIKIDYDLSFEECQTIAALAAAIPFTFVNRYDFSFSQVTLGGIDINNLNRDLSSKLEKNVYFAGEVIDVDGPCGGYNLRWAIGSSLRVADEIDLS